MKSEINNNTLNLLRVLKKSQDQYQDFASLSKAHGMSGAEIQAGIQSLAEKAYRIEQKRELGVKLAGLPDMLYPWEIQEGLATEFLGHYIEHHTEIDSTNRRALEWAKNGAIEGAVVVAELQKQGRGRFDRNWVSPMGQGIYATVILRPSINVNMVAQLTLLTGVAIVEAVRSVVGCPAALKWPNDVLINGKKLCGILAEVRMQKKSLQPEYVVIGFGINVNLKKENFPEECQESATSLFIETGKNVSRIVLLKEILKSLEKNYQQFKAHGHDYLRAAWLANNCTIGHQVEIKTGWGETIVGVAKDLSATGGLLVESQSGLHEYLAGDVSIGSKSFQ